MTKQITLKQALELVSFIQDFQGDWHVDSVYGNVGCHVYGNVGGDVTGFVGGNVHGTIDGKQWQSIETPKEKLRRLIEKGADKEELLEAFNRLEQS